MKSDIITTMSINNSVCYVVFVFGLSCLWRSCFVCVKSVLKLFHAQMELWLSFIHDVK